jgi:hypothetical protein
MAFFAWGLSVVMFIVVELEGWCGIDREFVLLEIGTLISYVDSGNLYVGS